MAAVIALSIPHTMPTTAPAQERFAVASASLDRRSEDIRVRPIIITELELRNIERHIFAAHFVERADDAALEDRPEAFNRVRVDRADTAKAEDLAAFRDAKDFVS